MSLVTYEVNPDWWKHHYSNTGRKSIAGGASHLTTNPNEDLARAMSTLAREKTIKGGARRKNVKRISTTVRETPPKRKQKITKKKSVRTKKSIKPVKNKQRKGPPNKNSKKRRNIPKSIDIYS